jgi:hypothetical protein
MDARRVIRTDRWVCPHCDQLLSTKTFKAHKRRYFDASSNSWLTKQSLDHTGDAWLEQDSTLSSAESSDGDPPAPLPLPVSADLADTDVLDSESSLPDFILHYDQDTNPRTGRHCGDNPTSSGSNGIV